MHLLIFDIDGTLATFAGITGRAFNRTFQQLYGQPGPWGKVLPHGKTDRAILRECLTAISLDGNFDTNFSTFVEAYLPNLRDGFLNADGIRLMPGVRGLLERLAAMDNACLALGTGNIERAARMKVKHLQIGDFFPVGGFGDFAEERRNLLKDAIHRATEHYQCTFAPDKTWVIGDTIYDIEGGKALGLRTLGVATGGLHKIEDLRRAEPDLLFEDLSNTNAVMESLGVQSLGE